MPNKNIIPFPLVIISVFTAALGFFEILSNSLSAYINDNVESNMLVITYAIDAMCMLNEDSDEEENMDRPAKWWDYNHDHSHVKSAVELSLHINFLILCVNKESMRW